MADAAPQPLFVESLPSWGAEVVRAVTAKQSSTFVLHGVPEDLVPWRSSEGLRFVSLDITRATTDE